MAISLLKNFASLFGAEVFCKVITFAAFAYLAHLNGPAGYGYIEWAGTVLMCASLIVDQGFSAYGAREIAKSLSETGRLVAEVVTARFLLAALGYLAIVIFAFRFVAEQAITNLLLVYGLSLWALPLLLQWVFQGHDRMQLVGITQAIRQTVFVLAVFVFVRGTGDLVWVGIAEVAGVTAAALFSVWMYRRYFSSNSWPRPALSARLFREGTPIGLSQMFWVLKMFGATFIVGLIATAEDTGYFAGAMRIYIALHTFVWLYFFNMLPSLSRAWVEGSEQLAGMIRHSMWIVALASLVVGVIWITTAPIVMTSVYGLSFLPGTAALQWLAGACIAAAVSGHYRYGLIAAGYQSKEMVATAIGSIVAVALVPIGYFNAGTGGAAAALFAAECVVLACAWLLARRHLFGRSGNGFAANESPLKTVPEAMQ
ncbi:MAG: oligosaccharide flippase family protein [Pyrinomonadaceae bacterium]